MPAANSSRCSRASPIPTSWSCSNCGRTRPRLTPTPNCRRSARLCRRGCGSAPASARTMPTTVPAERGRHQNAGLVFRKRPLLRALQPAAAMADAGRRLRSRGGLARFRGMVERSRYVEELGFDWVSVSEHHYSPRILTPSLPIAAAYIASHVHNIKIALLGPIVPQSNPVLLAEEMAMLDTMADGRLIVGMLRGTTNEMLTYDLNPEESRERTDEGMELILRAWREPQPFGWQGRHFRYRTVSVWPKPLQRPHPPTYALGTSREAGEFAARNRIGLGVSFGPFDAMGRVTGYYKDQCARWRWQPEPHQIIYRANIVISETDEKAQQALAQYPREAVFPLKAGVAAELLQ